MITGGLVNTETSDTVWVLQSVLDGTYRTFIPREGSKLSFGSLIT